MSKDTTHDRKVRGSQIRSSRADKQQRRTTDRAKKSVDRLEKQQTETGTDPGETASALSDQFVPDDQPFVETAAVRRLMSRTQRWLDAEYPVHCVGPTGCGKTALAMQVARQRDRPVVWINGDAGLTTSDLVGEYAETERVSERDKYIHNVIKSKDIVRDRWVDNPLTIAVREGATLVYNEFSRTKPAANNVLLSVFEEGVLELPGQRGESRYVDVHPEFRAVLTSNSVEYAGVHAPQDALLDRLVSIHMEFYDRETEVEIVRAHTDDAAADHVVPMVELFRELRDQLEITVGTRAAIMAVRGISATDTLSRSVLVDLCVDVLASKVSQLDAVRELRSAVETAIVDLETVPVPAQAQPEQS